MSKIYVDEIHPKTSGGQVAFPSRPAFAATGTGTGWVALDTNDVVAFNSATPTTDSHIMFNQGGHFNTSTYTFTCPVDGVYYFGFCIYSAESDTTNGFNLSKNGSSLTSYGGSSLIAYYGDAGATDTTIAASYTLLLQAGDQMNVVARLPSDVYYPYSWFHGHLIG